MSGWIGVDLDGTLAEYHLGTGKIGKPVPAMLDRVRNWLHQGKDVRIFTARASSPVQRDELLAEVHAWLIENVGRDLPVTATKDFSMIELWDDRCVHVEENTGRVLG